jgi:hypothetical protein
MSQENDYVVVYAGSVVDADFVKMLLESEGIEALLLNEHMGRIAPWYVTPAGAGAIKVLVAREDVPVAESLVQDFLKKNNSQE